MTGRPTDGTNGSGGNGTGPGGSGSRPPSAAFPGAPANSISDLWILDPVHVDQVREKRRATAHIRQPLRSGCVDAVTAGRMPPPPEPAAHHDPWPHIVGQGRLELHLPPLVVHPHGIAVEDAARAGILGVDLQAGPLFRADV